MLEEEQQARARESRAASERLEALRDELGAEAARERAAERTRREALYSELEAERSQRSQLEIAVSATPAASAAPGTAVAPPLAATEAEGVGQAEGQQKAQQKVADLEELVSALRRELRASLDERGDLAQVPRGARTLRTGARCG